MTLDVGPTQIAGPEEWDGDEPIGPAVYLLGDAVALWLAVRSVQAWQDLHASKQRSHNE